MSTKIQQSIQYSLDCRWDEAIELNLEILADNSQDLPTLNRLAKCYLQIGDKNSAKDVYQKVLEIDKYNPVALKNLKTLGTTPLLKPDDLCSEDFIESPGLTRSTSLIKLADKKTLTTLSCRQLLALKPKARLISVTTSSGTYIGTLPDDLSLKLKTLLVKGYTYQVCLKHSSASAVYVFIRELKRPNRLSALPSFGKHAKL